MNTTELRPLIFIVILGCLLRLSYAFWVPNEFSHGTGFPDSYGYVSIAQNVAKDFQYANSWRNPGCQQCFGDIGLTSFREPVFPLVLALQFKLFGESPRTNFLIQALLGTLTIPLCFGIASMLVSSRAALLAALLETMNPYHIHYAAFISSENITIIILLALVFFTLRVLRSINTGEPIARRDLTLLTLFFSAGILTRAVFISIVLVTLIFIVIAFYRKSAAVVPTIRSVGPLTLLMLLCVSPWFIRNYLVWHTFVYQTNAGQNLLMGFNDRATGGDDDETRFLELDLEMVPYGYNEVERNRIYKDAALEWIRSNPGRAVYLSIKKQLLFWWPIPAVAKGYQKVIGATWGTVFLTLTVLGLAYARSEFLTHKYLLAVIVIYSLFHSVPMAVTRYRVPLEGLLAVFAGYGLYWLLCTLQSRVRKLLPIRNAHQSNDAARR
jgi:4-amino-4-deoxy-L-arabinose transferase-like glycosyltransferase